MFHPLMNDFVQVRNSFLKDKQPPSHEELTKHFHAYIHARTDMHEQLHVERKLKMAQSYEEVMNILFDCICKWLSFSYLEMIVEAFPNHLLEAREALNRYKEKLREALQMKFDCTERVLKEANVTEDMPPEGMRKVVVRYNLDAGGITLEDVASYRQFLSSILEIPHHLMVLISALYGSLLLEVWIPEELTPRVVRRVEEVWRELWRRKVEGIEVGDRNFDLLQVEMYIYDQNSRVLLFVHDHVWLNVICSCVVNSSSMLQCRGTCVYCEFYRPKLGLRQSSW